MKSSALYPAVGIAIVSTLSIFIIIALRALNIWPADFEDTHTSPVATAILYKKDYEGDTLYWMPVEYVSSPRKFGPTYVASAKYLGSSSPVVFDVMLGVENGNMIGGTCVFDRDTGMFTENAQWRIQPVSEFLPNISAGTLGRVRFVVNAPSQQSNEEVFILEDLIRAINNNQEGVETIISPTEVCVAEL